MKLDVLAIAPHPDDAEINCGGTLAKSVHDGLKVGILDLTQGEMGTRGSVEKRFQESDNASKALGIHWRHNLGLPDGQIKNTLEFQSKVIDIIRKTQPTLCLISGPKDRHPDHNHAHQLLTDALFFSGLAKKHPEAAANKWRPVHVLLYMHDTPFEPDLILDISATFEQKINSILCYDSQINSTSGTDPQTYISGNDYFELIKAKARYFGHLGGFQYGEAFQYAGGPIPMSGLSGLISIERKR